MPELFANAEFMLTEGGHIRPMSTGRSAWGVTINEKSPCWLELKAEGRAGHGSTPSRDQAVPRLVAALDRVRRIESPLRVLPIVERMFATMAPLANPDDARGYADLKAAVVSEGGFQRRFLANPSHAALVRNTVAITVLRGSQTTNVIPGQAVAHLDARLLPGERCEDFTQAIRRIVDDDSVTVTPLLAFPSIGSSPDTALFRAIERAAEIEDPEAIVVPQLIAGFTDAHWFRELGITAYGFVPRRLTAAETSGVHGIDERVRIEMLEESGRTTAAILKELPAGAPAD
jgi:acetylornithine deacetylase/succinyl-diaminopimelate desuccinylase-like protein